jgi:hypothetical protein
VNPVQQSVEAAFEDDVGERHITPGGQFGKPQDAAVESAIARQVAIRLKFA